MPLNTQHPIVLSLQVGGKDVGQPLPAEEQLAMLLHMTDNMPLLDTPGTGTRVVSTPLSLEQAYTACGRIIRHHSKSFFFSTQFLPVGKRRAVRALYAFCRTTDDIVDMAEDDPARALGEWVRQVRAPAPPPDDPVLLAWHDTRIRYNLPSALVDELLAGVAMDLTIDRYNTFADLWLYCYRVASVVGLLSMGIIGSAAGAEPYAIKLGVAAQLTNILRDIGEDARRGRVYVPQEDLERFDLCDEDILAGVCDQRFRDLIDFEIARTRQLYDESWRGIVLLPPDSRLAIGAAAWVYRGILDKVIVNDYDVYHKRAYLSLREKIRLLPDLWQALRQLNREHRVS